MRDRRRCRAAALAVLGAAALLIALSARAEGALSTVDRVDLARYAGTWYEHGRLPNRLQGECARDVTTTFSPKGPRTLEVVTAADVVVVVLDRSRPLDEEDAAVLGAAGEQARVVVRNKADLAEAWPSDPGMIDVSARTGAGISELSTALERAVPSRHPEPTAEPVVVTRARHHEAILACAYGIERARSALLSRDVLEIVACELQSAAVELERLLGSTDVDELLDRIFRRFCVGK